MVRPRNWTATSFQISKPLSMHAILVKSDADVHQAKARRIAVDIAKLPEPLLRQ
jgi:hypothetical protein